MAPYAYGPNPLAPNWTTDLFASDSPDASFPARGDLSLIRDVIELHQFFSSFAGEDFFGQSPQDWPSAQAVELIPAPLGVSSAQLQIAAPPVEEVGSDWDLGYERATGPNLWPTSEIFSPTAVPAILLPAPPSSPAEAFPANWIEIPQRTYNQGLRQRNFKRLEPICFGTKDHPGINLGDALRKNFVRLQGRDDPMLQGLSGSISCRLLFPGYPDNCGSCQIHAQDWTKARKPILRSKLAHEVARRVDRYLTQLIRITPDSTIDDRWRAGHGFMRIDNMFLVSLESVSKGSFQPEIWVAAPAVPHVPAYANGYHALVSV